jgi:hypothetical protein
MMIQLLLGEFCSGGQELDPVDKAWPAAVENSNKHNACARQNTAAAVQDKRRAIIQLLQVCTDRPQAQAPTANQCLLKG